MYNGRGQYRDCVGQSACSDACLRHKEAHRRAFPFRLRARCFSVLLVMLHQPNPSYCTQITWDDLQAAERAVGEFGGDNRAGVQVNSGLNYSSCPKACHTQP